MKSLTLFLMGVNIIDISIFQSFLTRCLLVITELDYIISEILFIPIVRLMVKNCRELLIYLKILNYTK